MEVPRVPPRHPPRHEPTGGDLLELPFGLRTIALAAGLCLIAGCSIESLLAQFPGPPYFQPPCVFAVEDNSPRPESHPANSPISWPFPATGGEGRLSLRVTSIISWCAEWRAESRVPWLTIEEESRSEPLRPRIRFRVAENPQRGARKGTIEIASQVWPLPVPSVWARFTVLQEGVVRIVNAASLLPVVSAEDPLNLQGPSIAVAPGELISIFGEGIGPATPAGPRINAAGLVDAVLSGTKVLFGEIAAPLLYVSQRQISGVVPYAVAGSTTVELRIERDGTRSDPVPLRVVRVAPALFSLDGSGRGQGAILNTDYSLNSPSNPANWNSIVMLFGTGEGQSEPPGVDGKISREVLPRPLLPVEVTVGGKPVEVLYAGAAPGLVAGVFQINVRLPPGYDMSGDQPVEVKVSGVTSGNRVTVRIGS